MNNNDKYLIVSDLDGTLLNSKSELSETTIQTVKELVNEGHIFCIATGRPLRSSLHIYKQLELDSLLINHNGSYISNPSDKEFTPIQLVFNKEIAKQILSDTKIQEIITNAFLEVDGQNYQWCHTNKTIEFKDDLWKYYHIDVNDENLINLNKNPENIKHDLYALLLHISDCDVNLFNKLMYHIKNISPYLQVRMIKIPNLGMMVEINTYFADKSMGVNYLTSYYGIPLDKVIAFGDADNDMRMLSKVKYGFAMSNGKDTAKMSARHITKFTNDEDGVSWDLKYFMKNKKQII